MLVYIPHCSTDLITFGKYPNIEEGIKKIFGENWNPAFKSRFIKENQYILEQKNMKFCDYEQKYMKFCDDVSWW